MDLKAHLISLPRWFGVPATATGVLLGVALVGEWGWNAVLAVAIGVLSMCYSHAMNSWLGYAWSKLDQGEPEVRSVEKPYTGGQNLIASGRVSLRGVLANSLAWLAGALVLTAVFAARTTPWAWVPVAIVAVCPFFYEWGKLHWMPEIPLSLGFGPAAVWLGMATSGHVDWWLGFVASLPLALIFGVWAEHADQYVDYEANWPKGGRSLGLLTAHMEMPLSFALAVFLGFTVAVHVVVVGLAGALAPSTFAAEAISVPLFVGCILVIDRRQKLGVLLGLAAITVFQVTLVVAQALA